MSQAGVRRMRRSAFQLLITLATWLSLALTTLITTTFAQQVTHMTYNLSSPRIHAGASVLGNNSIAVAGGKTQTGWSSVIDIFNIETKQWSTTTLPTARADQGGPAEGALPGGNAFFGGQIAPQSEGDVVVLNSEGKRVGEAVLKVPRSILSCASSGAHNVIVCAGGQNKALGDVIPEQATDVITLNDDGSVASVNSNGKLQVGRKKLSGAAAGDLVAFGMGYSDIKGKTEGTCSLRLDYDLILTLLCS